MGKGTKLDWSPKSEVWTQGTYCPSRILYATDLIFTCKAKIILDNQGLRKYTTRKYFTNRLHEFKFSSKQRLTGAPAPRCL